jgi:small-conductance mechanosensitive channel
MDALRQFIGNDYLYHLLIAIGILVASIIVGMLLKRAMGFLVKHVFARTKTELDDAIVNVIKGKIVSLCFVIGGYLAATEFDRGLMADDPKSRQVLFYLEEGLYILLIIVVVLLVTRILDAIATWYIHKVAVKTESTLDEEFAPLANRAVNIVLYIVALIFILDHFGQNVSSLVVSLGVGTAAVAFAAKETFENIISGFVIMIDRPFRKGDRVQLPSGVVGMVYEVGLRSTKVLDDNQVMTITPNAEIVRKEVFNFSYPSNLTRTGVKFSVAYGTDLTAMSDLLVKAALTNSDVVSQPVPEVRVLEFGEFAVHCILFCYVKTPHRIPLIVSNLHRLVYHELRNAGIEIPFPQRVLHFSEQPQNEKQGIPTAKT